ncbi:MAG: hypothetical protein QM802_25765 [Agriterribacter sp.]
MSKKLEHFAKDNRNNFDSADPSPNIWDEIAKKMENKQNIAPVRSMKKKWWAVAACVAVVVVSAAVYMSVQQPKQVSDTITAVTEPNQKANHDADIEAIDPAYAKQVAQFSGLIEEKQKELQSIRVDQPSLYEQFSDDIKKLDSTYHLLKHELPVNPNKEELLQAMIYNLQLQIDLLNQQLNVIQKIKQSKIKTL